MLQTCNADGVIGLQMFMFGTTALEQFMDRVIEWPQYCNHILQISHLRGTHFEMVSAIERALAKISSSQNEPNVGNLLSAEQHVSGSSSMEGIEVTLSHKLEEGEHILVAGFKFELNI
jgi:CCR4-NOT transcription complex subunit 1